MRDPMERIKRRHEYDEIRDMYEAERRRELIEAERLEEIPEKCRGCAIGRKIGNKFYCMFGLDNCQRDAFDKILKRGSYRENMEKGHIE